MHPIRQRTTPGSAQSPQRGIAMIESLVAMLVIAIWLLANAGLQANAIRFQKSAEYRLAAVSLATELGERMEANRAGALGGNYDLAATDEETTSTASCAGANRACTPLALAQFDLAQWSQRAVESLKISSISVETVTSPGVAQSYLITISWFEPRGRRDYGNGDGAAEVMSYSTTKAIQ
jgi:type IV pilus assembly protein PilV